MAGREGDRRGTAHLTAHGTAGVRLRGTSVIPVPVALSLGPEPPKLGLLADRWGLACAVARIPREEGSGLFRARWRAQDTAARLCNLALEHQAAGRLAEAERCFRGALDADPHHADSLNGLGIVAHQVGDSAAAVELIGEAITANGRVAPYHYNLGLVLTALGRTAEAVQHYRRAVALKPDYADAHTNLAAALVELGQLKDAALHLRRALSRRPDQPSAYSNLALVLLSNGNADKALDVVVLGLGVKATDELKLSFGAAIEQLQAPPRISGLRRLILRALRERWQRPECLPGTRRPW